MLIHNTRLSREHLSLQIAANTDFDHFDGFATALAAMLDCQVLERQWGADRHQWLLDFEGSRVWLHYEFYGDICWLSVEHDSEFEILQFLHRLLLAGVRA